MAGHHSPPAASKTATYGREFEATLSPTLHRLAVLTAGTTFCLIIAGALVVGNGAGLAVPDWPLSFGTYMPPMVGGVFYEHGHRLIAATVGLLTVALAVWLGRTEPRRWVRALGWIGVTAVLVQAILGGITVLYRLPTPVVVFHACLAQLFFCVTLSLAVFTGRSWNLPASQWKTGKRLSSAIWLRRPPQRCSRNWCLERRCVIMLWT